MRHAARYPSDFRQMTPFRGTFRHKPTASDDAVTRARIAMEAADAALLAAEDAGVMPAGEVAVLALRALNAEEAWFDARDAWRPPVSDRQLAAEDLAAEFGTDVSEWLI